MISWLDNLLPSCCSRKRKEEFNKPVTNPNPSDLSDNPDDLPEDLKETPQDPSPMPEFFESKLATTQSLPDDRALFVSFKPEDAESPQPNLFETKKSMVLIAPSPPDSVQVEVIYESRALKTPSPEPFCNFRRVETDPVDLLNTSFGSKRQASLNATSKTYKQFRDSFGDTSSTGITESRRNSETWKQSIQSAKQILGKCYYRRFRMLHMPVESPRLLHQMPRQALL